MTAGQTGSQRETQRTEGHLQSERTETGAGHEDREQSERTERVDVDRPPSDIENVFSRNSLFFKHSL